MEAFPAFIALAGARVVVVGDGPAAEAKARLFANSPSTLVRLAARQALEADAYAGAKLVFIALDDAPTAATAAGLARAAGALVNTVDRPEFSDFLAPAVIDRGPVVGAVSTTGASPVLATRLRAEIEALWPAGLGHIGELSRKLQAETGARFPDFSQRRAALHAMLDGPAAKAAVAGQMDEAESLARAGFESAAKAQGSIVFIIAPPHPDRLSLAAARALARAEVLVAAPTVPDAILNLVRREAEHHPDAPPADWVRWAAAGQRVVRLGPFDNREFDAVGGQADILQPAPG